MSASGRRARGGVHRRARGGLAALLLAAAWAGACGREPPEVRGGTRLEVDLSGPGWRLLLDPEAPWEDDLLHAPGVDVARQPVRPPTGGWAALEDGVPVTVPGTVEALTWDALGDHRGVSWWWRELTIPAGVAERRVVLAFDAVRLRAEVFLDGQLVGYDAVGNTPFEVDLTGRCEPGRVQRLAVRVTDPSGNFDWVDHTAHRWGRQPIPASHGFAGITGPVRLLVTDALHVADVFVRNTPALDDVVVEVELVNPEPAARTVDAGVAVHAAEGDDAGRPGRRLFAGTWRLELPPGRSVHALAVTVTDAPRWSPEAPRLAFCRVSLAHPADAAGAPGPLPPAPAGDGAPAPDGPVPPPAAAAGELRVRASAAAAGEPRDAGPPLHAGLPQGRLGDEHLVRFGFRWFAPDGLGDDAVLRLNGERIVLRSAISWGFWPVTGLVPSRELAERQVQVAQELGLNMLNHHRTIAAPGLLDVHDRRGLLAHLEPGGYWAQGGDDLCFRLAREKWLRMVRAARNHPSVVVLNMINEASEPPAERAVRDLEAARALDPTRVITYTSAWSETQPPRTGLHVRPGEDGRHTEGWWDQHDAPGPGVWRDEFWDGPDEHRRRTDVRGQVVFFGEDGAIGMPPRLERIAQQLARTPFGWDGRTYLEWKAGWELYLDRKGLRASFPGLDALTGSLSDVGYDYHARVLENVRLADVADGFVINGWDACVGENHSGLVDAWRHPKGDVARLAAANAPLVLPVKLRRKVARTPPGSWASVVADVGVVNERGLSGEHELVLRLTDESGATRWDETRTVTLSGGDVFGELLVDALRLDVDGGAGRYTLAAELRDRDGRRLVTGQDELLLVDWHSVPLPAPESGALYDGEGRVREFLAGQRGLEVPEFVRTLPALDWVLVADVDPEPAERLPDGALRLPDADEPGLRGSYFDGVAHEHLVATRTDAALDFTFGAPPLEGLQEVGYSVRWDARLLPPESGRYRLHLQSAGGVRLWLGGRLVLDRWRESGPTLDTSEVVELVAGQPIELRVEYFQGADGSRVRLWWTPPSSSRAAREAAEDLVRRVRDDGTTLLVLAHADGWARLLDEHGAVESLGRLQGDRYWLGGGFAVRAHPVFDGLPVDQAMGWEYQELVHYGTSRQGLLLEGEEPLVLMSSGHQPRLATAIGVVRHGLGRILLCTFELPSMLPDGPPGPRDVPALILCNALQWAGAREEGGAR